MTEAMPFLQKAILLSYAPRSFGRGFLGVCLCAKVLERDKRGIGLGGWSLDSSLNLSVS